MKSRIRCSELDRVLSCNGSLTLVPLVAPRQGDDGWEGSAIHHAIASRLIAEFGALPPDGGLPPPDVPPGYTIPANSLWLVDWLVRHVRETVPDEWSLMVEGAFEHEFERWILTGHIDLLAISPDGTRSIGMDYKTVRNAVDPADNNEQVAGYIVNQKCAWPSLKIAEFQIVQPRIMEGDGVERVSRATVSDIDALVTSLDRRVCAAINNAMEVASSRKACQYCPVSIQCPELRAKQKEQKMKLTKEMISEIRKQPDDATLGEWVMTARILAQPTKDAEELLHARLDETGCVAIASGVTITRKLTKGHYEITHPKELFAAAKSLLGTDEHMAAVFQPSFTRMVDEVAAVVGCPKTGKNGVTAQGIVDAQCKPFARQHDRRVLVFSE